MARAEWSENPSDGELAEAAVDVALEASAGRSA
jgi:hypothetical protein